MARRYTNYDHYCEICGKRIEDEEDYWRCPHNLDFCEKCANEMCENCDKCNSTKKKENENPSI